jgi:hypothetical protein
MIMSDGSLRMRRDNRLPPDWRACLSLAGHYYPGVLNALSGPVVPRVRTGARAERSAAATHQPSCNQVMSGSRRGSPILCARWPVAINYSALKGKVWCSDSMLAMRFRPCWRVDGRPVMDCRKTGSLCAQSALRKTPHDRRTMPWSGRFRTCRLVAAGAILPVRAPAT